MELPRIDNANLWDKTYHILKEKIIQRTFAPNEKLMLPELAKQLGVSRTPIRDALTRLEMEGLVSTVPKVGTFVTAIGRQDVEQIMDTRLMLELWTVNKIAAFDPNMLNEPIRRLGAILDESRKESERLPVDEYLKRDYNLSFHLAFIELGNNPRNTAIYKSVMNYRFIAFKNTLVTKEMIVSAINQHEEIFQALNERDFDKLRAMIADHLEDAKKRIIEQIEAHGGTV
mgnify:CR=1 FL=1